MKILITGGAGFIGSHLTDACLARGDQITIVDNLSTGRKENLAHLEGNPSVKLIVDSIFNTELMRQVTSECDQIFHLAAAVGVKYILDNPFSSLMTNIKGTEIVLEIANEFKKPIIMASSSYVYGKSKDYPFVETGDVSFGPPTKWHWSYPVCKLIDEFFGLGYHREYGLPVTMVRFFNTVGPRQTGAYGMVLPRFVQQALSQKPITVFGTGKQSRAFGDVHDAVAAVIKLSKCPKAYGEIVNVGGQEEVSMENLAKAIKEKTGSQSKITYTPYEIAYGKEYEDIDRRIACCDKLFGLTGFKPQAGLDVILTKAIAYYKEHL